MRVLRWAAAIVLGLAACVLTLLTVAGLAASFALWWPAYELVRKRETPGPEPRPLAVPEWDSAYLRPPVRPHTSWGN